MSISWVILVEKKINGKWYFVDKTDGNYGMDFFDYLKTELGEKQVPDDISDIIQIYHFDAHEEFMNTWILRDKKKKYTVKAWTITPKLWNQILKDFGDKFSSFPEELEFFIGDLDGFPVFFGDGIDYNDGDDYTTRATIMLV